jgi:hypothetical protein
MREYKEWQYDANVDDIVPQIIEVAENDKAD